MKKVPFLITHLSLLGVLIGLTPPAFSQEALDKLITPDQESTNSSGSALTKETRYGAPQGNDDAKDKASISVPYNTEKASGPIVTKLLAGEKNSKYTLGPEDVITITVLRHPEVSGQYIINTEGKIQYEFVGDEILSGLTKEEAQSVIAKRLETYIVNPEVTIKIAEYNSKVVYVVGEVGAPGKIFMRGDTITVRDALLAAGLPQLTAATDSAVMFTPSGSGRVRQKKVNVYALLYKGDLRENYTLKPGDTIYLPATLWAKVARFINPVTQPVSQTAGTAAAVGF